MNKKKYLLFIAIILCVNCSMLLQESEQPSVSFSYTPPQSSNEKTDITIAIVKPRYSSTMANYYSYNRNMQDFLDNLVRDTEELLIARGYSLSGPYSEFDEMTYIDKKNAILALTPQVDIMIEKEWTKGEPGSLHQEGYCEAKGSISLVIIETFTKEKIWRKNINLGKNIRAYFDFDEIGNKVVEGISSYTAESQLLEKLYPVILDRIWDHMHPEEMKIVKQYAEDARDRG
jgi:hypothetical protein